jgi:hypothetical protein
MLRRSSISVFVCVGVCALLQSVRSDPYGRAVQMSLKNVFTVRVNESHYGSFQYLLDFPPFSRQEV